MDQEQVGSPSTAWTGREVLGPDGRSLGRVLTVYRDGDADYALVSDQSGGAARRVPASRLRDGGAAGLSLYGEDLGEAGRVAQFELKEEVPEVRVERVPAGSVSFERQTRRWTETVEVELREDVLVIRSERADGAPGVLLDGAPLDAGAEERIVLYREEAWAQAVPVISERVEVSRDVQVERQVIPVDLRREELEVRQSGEAIVREERR